jgi:endonuclease/exonuclease/phosphatase family metal-dependent hydrolase
LLGDLNAKCEKEGHFLPIIGSESVHDTSNDNGLRVISFAASKDMIISITTFPHKDIHKITCKSPDGKTANQIDHVLIQKRFRSCIINARSFRGADCDADHFLVLATLRINLLSQKKTEGKKKDKSQRSGN